MDEAAPRERDGIEVGRQLDEQSSTLRRNQAQLVDLTDAVSKLAALQRKNQRLFSLNSFVAYLIFALAFGGGALLLYRSRAGELVSARARAIAERDSALTRATELQEQLAARDLGAQQAYAFWSLLRDGKRNEAMTGFADLNQQGLTATERELFAAELRKARTQLVDAGYLAGVEAFRARAYDKAAAELRRSLAYEEEGPRAAQMRYYLGVSLYQQKDAAEAGRQLELALAGRVNQAGISDARYWLGLAYEAQGKLDAASTELNRFASDAPTNPLANAARRRAILLSRTQAQGGAAPPPPAAIAPPPAAPAPPQ